MTTTTVGPFQVGERPSRPLTIRVLDDPVEDLTLFTTLTVEGIGPGTIDVDPADRTRILFTPDGPFTTAGVLVGRVRMGTADTVDYSSEFTVEVLDSPAADPDAPAPLVTPDEVYRYTTLTVSGPDVVRAQALLAARLDRDLYDAEWVAGLSDADRRRLRTAVAWQAGEPAPDPGGGGMVVTSFSEGDRSVTVQNVTGDPPAVRLHPMTEIVIGRLSWRRTNTITPTHRTRWRTWVNDDGDFDVGSVFNGDIVRGLPDEEDLWR
jgi:hypothetical protein